MTMNSEARVLISFDVFSTEHTLTTLNSLFDIEPDISRDIGEEIGFGAAKAKASRWSIVEVGNDLNESESVFVRLMSRLRNLLAQNPMSLPHVEPQLTVCLRWHLGDPSPGIRLEPKALEVLSKSGIPLEIVTEVYP